MGMRVNYELIGAHGTVECILYSDSSDPTLDPQAEFA